MHRSLATEAMPNLRRYPSCAATLTCAVRPAPLARPCPRAASAPLSSSLTPLCTPQAPSRTPLSPMQIHLLSPTPPCESPDPRPTIALWRADTTAAAR